MRPGSAAMVVVLLAARAQAAPPPDAETVAIRSGPLTLKATVWKPVGKGPFPAVLFNHGSYSASDTMPAEEPAALGPVFARHGYVFLFLFRQGTGLSTGQGMAGGEQMARALAAGGPEARNRVQLDLYEHAEMDAAKAGLAWLRGHPEVDRRRIAVVGHSFGGSLSVLLSAQDPDIGAAVVFGGAAGSWNNSPGLRERLMAAVGRIKAPVLFIHAANDYSTAPGEALAAEMQRLGKPHSLKIYPSFGKTRRDGHNILYRSVSTWEADVFAFLDAHLER